MANTSVSLGSHFEKFVADQINDGRYGSASEVIRAGLRMLEVHESKIEALRAALVEGEKSELLENFDVEDLIQELDNERLQTQKSGQE